MKYILLIGFSALLFNCNAQLSNPYEMIYYPVRYDSVINFINDSDKYKNSQLEDSYLQSLGTLYSFLGNYEKAEELFIIRNTKLGYIPKNKKQIYLTEFGISQDSLTRLYGNFNIILINEAHHISRHRAFLFSQLELLKGLGFNQLALEALDKKDIELKSRDYAINNYPTQLTGVYINDPVYGNLIRKALSLGFSLIPYDSYNINREEEQAENILKQYDTKKGKLIIYGGYRHISEKSPMMGYYLKQQLKEDMLTISQFTPHSVEPIFPQDTKFDFFLKEDSVDSYDYYLYSNTTKSNSNIPSWYKWMNFKTFPLEKLLNQKIEENALIQLFNYNEENGIPIYQFLTHSNENIKIAYPQSGVYLLRITSHNGIIEKKINL